MGSLRGCEGAWDTTGATARFERADEGVLLWCSTPAGTYRVQLPVGTEERKGYVTHGMWARDHSGAVWALTSDRGVSDLTRLATGEHIPAPSVERFPRSEVYIPETWDLMGRFPPGWWTVCVARRSSYLLEPDGPSTKIHRVDARGGVEFREFAQGPTERASGCLGGSVLVSSRSDAVAWFMLPSLRVAGEIPLSEARHRYHVVSSTVWGLLAWDVDDTHLGWASLDRRGRLVETGTIELQQRGVLADVMFLDGEVCVAVAERKNPATSDDGFVVRVVCQVAGPKVARQVGRWSRWVDRTYGDVRAPSAPLGGEGVGEAGGGETAEGRWEPQEPLPSPAPPAEPE